jgi:acetolactate synthase-1/2/3 large subunit
MAPITKFSASVPSTERAADLVSMGFLERYPGVPMPSFLEISRDARDARDAKVPVDKARAPRPGGHRGSQVWTTRRSDAATEFAGTRNVPAVLNGAGRGTRAPSDPHHRTRPSAPRSPTPI